MANNNNEGYQPNKDTSGPPPVGSESGVPDVVEWLDCHYKNNKFPDFYRDELFLILRVPSDKFGK